jgi:predicted ABC-type ATPase
LSPPSHRPRLWIIAGPNGCGKSTAYSRSDIAEFDGSVWIINPDLLTARLVAQEDLKPLDANLQAVVRIEEWLHASVAVHQTIGVETVLSTAKYRPLVEKARRLGFEIRLIYVIVDTTERQIERVRLRVRKGGHDVPDDKIKSRRAKSLEQLGWFFEQADYALVYDNSSAEPRVMVELDGDVILVSDTVLPEIARALGLDD